jgi:hypothetical protein
LELAAQQRLLAGLRDLESLHIWRLVERAVIAGDLCACALG